MSQVFVSYSRADQDWVEEMTAALEQSGFDVWIDTRKIPASVVWLDEIRDAIEASSLVVAFESDSFRDSVHCSAELAIATEFDRAVLAVPVGESPTTVVDTIRSTVREIPADVERSIELSVRAREWERRGRGRRGLVAGGTLRALRRSRGRLAAVTPTVDAFLRASRRRVRIRRMIIFAGTLVAILALGLQGILDAASRQTDDANEQLGAALTEVNQARSAVSRDIYDGLELLALLGTTESAIRGDALATGLSAPVPDDAFTLPVAASHFVEPSVDNAVIVEAEDGSIWQRSSIDRDVRNAEESKGDLPRASTDVHDSGFEIRVGDGSALVTLLLEGQTYRRLVAAGPVTVARVSPNGREIAIASADFVDVLDVDTGVSKVIYRGAPEPITDVAWSSDGSRIWATSGTYVVSWQRRQGTVVLDRPGSWFLSVFPSATEGAVWVAEIGGQLLEVDLDTGTVLRSIDLNADLLTAAGSSGGEQALVVGTDHTWLVDLASGEFSEIASDCAAVRPAFAEDGPEVYASCGGAVFVIDRRSGDVLDRIDLGESEPWALAVDPSSGELVVGDQLGGLVRIAGSVEHFPHPPGNGCDTPYLSIDVAPNGDVVVGGVGTGQLYCASLIRNADSGYDWQNLSHAAARSNRSRSILMFADGEKYATGYGDGRIIITPVENFLPQVTIDEVVGDVRDMIEMNGDLIAVTRAGIIHRYPIDPSPPTNERLASEARDRLERSRELGLHS